MMTPRSHAFAESWQEEELRRKAQQEADAERAQRAERERQQDEQSNSTLWGKCYCAIIEW